MERAGVGLSLVRDGHRYFLGRAGEGTALLVDGAEVARFEVKDQVRPDARRSLDELQADGLSVHLLSGDRAERAAATARELGIPEGHAEGDLSPADKAARVAALDAEDTLYLGDGINDSLAFERAFCAGTPAIDRPVLPGKADFFLLGETLGALHTALALAQRLRRTVRRNLVLAVAYNLFAVASCLSGIMTPLRAAISMPASSVAILLLTAASLRRTAAARDVQEAGAGPGALEVPA
jgi:Cu2+-exporting ATPase